MVNFLNKHCILPFYLIHRYLLVPVYHGILMALFIPVFWDRMSHVQTWIDVTDVLCSFEIIQPDRQTMVYWWSQAIDNISFIYWCHSSDVSVCFLKFFLWLLLLSCFSALMLLTVWQEECRACYNPCHSNSQKYTSGDRPNVKCLRKNCPVKQKRLNVFCLSAYCSLLYDSHFDKVLNQNVWWKDVMISDWASCHCSNLWVSWFWLCGKGL